MRQVLILLSVAVAFAAAQTFGNHELLNCVNTAMDKWRASGAAAASWKSYYGEDYPLAQSTCTGFSYPDTPTTDGTLAAVIKRGELKIGSDYPSPPLYYPASNGTVIGFDQEFANFLASELSTKYNKKITVTRVPTNFDALLTQLNNNNPFDVVSAGMQRTADRQVLADPSCNISTGSLTAAILASNAETYKTIDDLTAAGVPIGAKNGTIQYAYAVSKGANIKPYGTLDDAYAAIADGTIKGWLGSTATIGYWRSVNQDKNLGQIASWGTVNGVVWWVRKDTTTPPTAAPGTTSAGAATVIALPLLVSAILAALF